MNAFGDGGFGGGIGEARSVPVDVYTAAYRVSGEVETRFSRVTEILNQLTGSHLTVTRATLSEHADPTSTVAAPSALVSVDEVLVMVAPDLGGPSGEMRIPKRPVLAQLGLPPLRVTGKVHIPMGSRPVDGLLLGTDRFIAMTDATIVSGPHPELTRTAPVIALRRDRAHVLLVADDERPDELLADVLDERTAAAWLRGAANGAGDEEGVG
jgi:hypothetical protein